MTTQHDEHLADLASMVLDAMRQFNEAVGDDPRYTVDRVLAMSNARDMFEEYREELIGGNAG